MATRSESDARGRREKRKWVVGMAGTPNAEPAGTSARLAKSDGDDTGSAFHLPVRAEAEALPIRATLVGVHRPIALLLHTLPDGTSHVDLLIAPDAQARGDDERAIPTWRCQTRPDRAPPRSELSIERIGDHRARYLRLAEPCALSEGRGRVEPLRSGIASERVDTLHVSWSDGGESRWHLSESRVGWVLRIESNRDRDSGGSPPPDNETRNATTANPNAD